VQADFDFLREWCEDRWHYVGVVVTLLLEDEDGELQPCEEYVDALWGIEFWDYDSSKNGYVEETAKELAGEVAHRYLKEQAERQAWAERDVMTVP